MHKGTVRVTAKGVGGGGLAGGERDGPWRSGHGTSGQDPQTRKVE